MGGGTIGYCSAIREKSPLELQESKPRLPFTTGVASLFISLREIKIINGQMMNNEWISSVLRAVGCFGSKGRGRIIENLKITG